MSSRLRERADLLVRYSLRLLVGAIEDNGGIFSYLPWRTRRIRRFREACPLMCRDLARVVLCEHALEDGSWKDVLELAASRPYPPLVIVTARLADERLWAEVLNLGGYDVLAQPLDRNEALRAIGLAWERWASLGERTRDWPWSCLQHDCHETRIRSEIDQRLAPRDVAYEEEAAASGLSRGIGAPRRVGAGRG
jgi:hypothetical protein